MIKIFTQPNPSDVQHQNLILHLYGELPKSQRTNMQASLILNQNLSDEADELIEVQGLLNELCEEPDDSCLGNILKYSTSFATKG
jgi:hypothetical protein